MGEPLIYGLFMTCIHKISWLQLLAIQVVERKEFDIENGHFSHQLMKNFILRVSLIEKIC